MGRIKLPKSLKRHPFTVEVRGRTRTFTFFPNFPLALLIPYDRNPRKNDNAVEPVARSIEQFGFNQPILISPEGKICAGHTRYKSAMRLGLETAPVIMGEDLTGNDFVAFNVADNQTAQIAEWDDALLSEIVTDLRKEMGDQIDVLGFDEAELTAIIDGLQDKADESTNTEFTAKVERRAATGDLWRLGSHRLLVGDSRCREDVMRLMDGGLAVICATDPPYFVNYSGKCRSHGKDWSEVYKDPPISEAPEFLAKMFGLAVEVTIEKAPFYCWHADINRMMFDLAWKDMGIRLHQVIVWVKSSPTSTRTIYTYAHEPCLFGWKSGKGKTPRIAKKYWNKWTTVWQVDAEESPAERRDHPTPKPLELFRRPMLMHTKLNDIVYEPFSGSGSQILAAEELGRRCYAMELVPYFADVAIDAWERMTDKKAVKIDG